MCIYIYKHVSLHVLKTYMIVYAKRYIYIHTYRIPTVVDGSCSFFFLASPRVFILGDPSEAFRLAFRSGAIRKRSHARSPALQIRRGVAWFAKGGIYPLVN